MRALREWLIKHEWFIWFCDPGPGEWNIRAIAPNGRRLWFIGTAERVTEVSAADDFRSTVI